MRTRSISRPARSLPRKNTLRAVCAPCGAPSSDRMGISTSRIVTRTASSATTATAVDSYGSTAIQHLTTPVHLAFRTHDGALLAGSRDGNAIFAIDPETGAVTTLIEPGAGGLRAPAGMAFGPDGWLYVSSRETKQILRFDASTGKPDATPFIDDLQDFPEFISLVGVIG